MTESATFARLLAAIDPALRLVASVPLLGGVSSQVTAVDAVLPSGRTERLVVRQYGAANMSGNPRSAAQEFELLTLLRSAGLPVPRPRYADESCSILPVPCLVTDFVDAAVITAPGQLTLAATDFAGRLAAAVARLHSAGLTLADAPYLPDIRARARQKLETRPAHPDAALLEAAIRAALARIWPPPQVNQQVVVHGDYWPGNALWRNGELVCIVDWEDAAVGDPLADVGNARMELCMLFGWPVAAEFTTAYQALRPHLDFTALPHWDLYSALRHTGRMDEWGLPDAQRAALAAGHRAFTTATLARLPGPG
jgi:aminoglycoside phosphotransferase (APT) family kinase protein